MRDIGVSKDFQPWLEKRKKSWFQITPEKLIEELGIDLFIDLCNVIYLTLEETCKINMQKLGMQKLSQNPPGQKSSHL